MSTIALPAQLSMRKPVDAVGFWVIYDHPSDFPNGFVLAAQWTMRDGVLHPIERWYASDPDQLRAILPPGLIGPIADPNPRILEVWME